MKRMFERTFDCLKAKLGVSDEQVTAWESEAKQEEVTAATAAVEAAKTVLADAEAKLAALTPAPEAPVESEVSTPEETPETAEAPAA
jgi:hypothetical protein